MSQILHHDVVYFAEVRFYFVKTFGGEQQAFALVSLYSPPDENLLRDTYNTLAVCAYQGEEALMIINVKSILSVVAMVPCTSIISSYGDKYFLIEPVGLDVIEADGPGGNE